MKANEAPKKIYILPHKDYSDKRIMNAFTEKEDNEDIEYVRTDAFIEKAAQFLYDYNQKQVLKHGARATLGCGEYTINVDECRNYMKGK